jgi:hypothetical protein
MRVKLIKLQKGKGGESPKREKNFYEGPKASNKMKNRSMREAEDKIKRQTMKESGIEPPHVRGKKNVMAIAGIQGIKGMKSVLVYTAGDLAKSRVSVPVGSHKMYGGRDFVKTPQGTWKLAEHFDEQKSKPEEKAKKQAPAPKKTQENGSSKSQNKPLGAKKPKVKLQIGSRKQVVGDGDTVKSNVRMLLEEYDAARAHCEKIEEALAKRYNTTPHLARRILGMAKKGASK